MKLSCPLCSNNELEEIFDPLFHKHAQKWSQTLELSKDLLEKGPHFFLCSNCKGIFRHPELILKSDLELSRYQTHNNTLEDPRYLKYLSQSLEFFETWMTPGSRGLDFGCGPSPGFRRLSQEKPYAIESYDKYFGPYELSPPYDFILVHEVIEHLTNPKEIFKNLGQWLKPNGYLFIRTELHTHDLETFLKWYYKNDHTHVFFYSQETFEFVAQHYNMKLIETSETQKCQVLSLKPF